MAKTIWTPDRVPHSVASPHLANDELVWLCLWSCTHAGRADGSTDPAAIWNADTRTAWNTDTGTAFANATTNTDYYTTTTNTTATYTYTANANQSADTTANSYAGVQTANTVRTLGKAAIDNRSVCGNAWPW